MATQMEKDNHSMRVKLWDLGPKEPEAPQRPQTPKVPDEAKGGENAPAYQLALMDFRAAISKYELDLAHYAREKRAYDDWQHTKGGPYTVEFWSMDARDALVRDPDRYVLDLPKGTKPGRYHHELIERERARHEDAQAARIHDPHFGQRGAAA